MTARIPRLSPRVRAAIFSHRFLSRHARRTRRQRYYSQSRCSYRWVSSKHPGIGIRMLQRNLQCHGWIPYFFGSSWPGILWRNHVTSEERSLNLSDNFQAQLIPWDLVTSFFSFSSTGVILHPCLPITAISLQRPLSSVPKVAIVERFHCSNLSSVQGQNRLSSVSLKPKVLSIPTFFLKRKCHKISSHFQPVIHKQKLYFWEKHTSWHLNSNSEIRKPRMTSCMCNFVAVEEGIYGRRPLVDLFGWGTQCPTLGKHINSKNWKPPKWLCLLRFDLLISHEPG